mmetsp:Transcript_33607/g.53898  ORF Transcript_33607/g.53898 Transcript_33607/m.53898 type:complete len:265 (-) Transcript_33607:2458-3252(-)
MPVLTPGGMMAEKLPAASAAALVATGSTRDVTVAWSYMMLFIMPYRPSLTKYWWLSSPGASEPLASERMRRENTMHARVTHVSAKYRPGSEMTRTPSAAGKRRSSESFTSTATAVSVTSFSLDEPADASAEPAPLKPPPMSSTFMVGRPRRAAVSKATRANSSASRNARGLVAPLPTWNATPATWTPRAWAARSSGSTSAGSAPYLLPRTQRASGSSARTRRSTRMSGASDAILCSSPSESNVVSDTPRPAAATRWRGSLHGLA